MSSSSSAAGLSSADISTVAVVDHDLGDDSDDHDDDDDGRATTTTLIPVGIDLASSTVSVGEPVTTADDDSAASVLPRVFVVVVDGGSANRPTIADLAETDESAAAEALADRIGTACDAARGAPPSSLRVVVSAPTTAEDDDVRRAERIQRAARAGARLAIARRERRDPTRTNGTAERVVVGVVHGATAALASRGLLGSDSSSFAASSNKLRRENWSRALVVDWGVSSLVLSEHVRREFSGTVSLVRVVDAPVRDDVGEGIDLVGAREALREFLSSSSGDLDVVLACGGVCETSAATKLIKEVMVMAGVTAEVVLSEPGVAANERVAVGCGVLARYGTYLECA